MINFKALAAKYLREVADNIDSGNCDLTEKEAMDVLKIIAHEPLSKEQSLIYLNISKSQFEKYIREGKIPKGIKRMGFKELVWYKDTLDACKAQIDYQKKK